jgi:hypothetical protein
MTALIGSVAVCAKAGAEMNMHRVMVMMNLMLIPRREIRNNCRRLGVVYVLIEHGG